MSEISVIDVSIREHPVGKLTLTPEGLCAFEYDVEFLKNGNSISPFFLPLQSKLFIAKQDPFQGGFGVFNDSLPDYQHKQPGRTFPERHYDCCIGGWS